MISGTPTTTGREVGMTSVAEAQVEVEVLEEAEITDSPGQLPVISTSPAAEATVTEAGRRRTGTLVDQDTSLEVEEAEVVVEGEVVVEVGATTTTGEMTTEEAGVGAETTGMSRGEAMDMVTTPMEDMEIPLMVTATLLMDMEILLTGMETLLMDTATLGQVGNLTPALEEEQVVATSTTLGLG